MDRKPFRHYFMLLDTLVLIVAQQTSKANKTIGTSNPQVAQI